MTAISPHSMLSPNWSKCLRTRNTLSSVPTPNYLIMLTGLWSRSSEILGSGHVPVLQHFFSNCQACRRQTCAPGTRKVPICLSSSAQTRHYLRNSSLNQNGCASSPYGSTLSLSQWPLCMASESDTVWVYKFWFIEYSSCLLKSTWPRALKPTDTNSANILLRHHRRDPLTERSGASL